MEYYIVLLVFYAITLIFLRLVFAEIEGRQARKMSNVRYFLRYHSKFVYRNQFSIIFVAFLCYMIVSVEKAFSTMWFLQLLGFIAVGVISDALSQIVYYYYINFRFKKDIVESEELKNENNVFDVDVTKLIINVNNSGITGKQLGDILRYKYNIEVEMDSLKYVLGITTICDDYKELERLAEALKEIDKSLEEKQNENISVELLKNKRMYSIYETDLKEKNTVNLFDSKDCISGEFVFLYPPGIPLVVPGEVITEELLEQIKVYLEANMNISGLKDNSNKTIEVVK